MEFRPCIDIHNGRVKQIVGGSLKDEGDRAKENYVSEQDAAFFAGLYRDKGLSGGHVIILNAAGSDYYNASKEQALSALAVWPGALQAGGGITPESAEEFLDAGAGHVIVTSYVFRNGIIDMQRLDNLADTVGKERLVLDLSCRKKDGRYYIVTDRWQKFTNTEVTPETMKKLSEYCDEFLIHAADVEGKASGVEKELIPVLREGSEMIGHDFPVTYAGGIGSFEDLEYIRDAGGGKINVTIGSALDLFGGSMKLDEIIEFVR